MKPKLLAQGVLTQGQVALYCFSTIVPTPHWHMFSFNLTFRASAHLCHHNHFFVLAFYVKEKHSFKLHHWRDGWVTLNSMENRGSARAVTLFESTGLCGLNALGHGTDHLVRDTLSFPLCGNRTCILVTSAGRVTNFWLSPMLTWMGIKFKVKFNFAALFDFPYLTGPKG